jgi:hypothetical protein
MTSALEEGEWSAARPGRTLPPGKTRYTLYRRLGGPQGRSGQAREISPPPGFNPWTVQTIVSRCTTELPSQLLKRISVVQMNSDHVHCSAPIHPTWHDIVINFRNNIFESWESMKALWPMLISCAIHTPLCNVLFCLDSNTDWEEVCSIAMMQV